MASPRAPTLKPPSLAHLLSKKSGSSPTAVTKLQQALRAHTTLTQLQAGAGSKADDVAGAALLLSTKRLLRRSPTKQWLIEDPLVRPELLTAAQLVAIAALLATALHANPPTRSCAHPWSLCRALFTLVYLVCLTLALHAGGECCYQALFSPLSLPNPSLRQSWPGRVYVAHYASSLLHLTVVGPICLATGRVDWYWAMTVALILSSPPIGPQQQPLPLLGSCLGRFRSEEASPSGTRGARACMLRLQSTELIILCVFTVVLASLGDAADWRPLGTYHWWLWGYRILELAPRRYLARRVSPLALALCCTALYISLPVLCWNGLIAFAGVPPCALSAGGGPISRMGQYLLCLASFCIFHYMRMRHYSAAVAASAAASSGKQTDEERQDASTAWDGGVDICMLSPAFGLMEPPAVGVASIGAGQGCSASMIPACASSPSTPMKKLSMMRTSPKDETHGHTADLV